MSDVMKDMRRIILSYFFAILRSFSSLDTTLMFFHPTTLPLILITLKSRGGMGVTFECCVPAALPQILQKLLRTFQSGHLLRHAHLPNPPSHAH